VATLKKYKSQSSQAKKAAASKSHQQRKPSKQPGKRQSAGGVNSDNSKIIEMTLEELLSRLPCGLTISMDSQDEWRAYYFYAIAAKEVTETFTNFDLSYLKLEARVRVAKMDSPLGAGDPYFEVLVDGGEAQGFTVYGKGLGDKWDEIITTDWSFTS
jgi:hypothetical protein